MILPKEGPFPLLELLPMNPIQDRLAAVRRRLRLIVTFRGAAWLIAGFLACTMVAGLIDWRWHLPGVVRAFLLAGSLSGLGYIAFRYLVRPLSARADDLTLALKIESAYPELNDSLASAVQF